MECFGCIKCGTVGWVNLQNQPILTEHKEGGFFLKSRSTENMYWAFKTDLTFDSQFTGYIGKGGGGGFISEKHILTVHLLRRKIIWTDLWFCNISNLLEIYDKSILWKRAKNGENIYTTYKRWRRPLDLFDCWGGLNKSYGFIGFSDVQEKYGVICTLYRKYTCIHIIQFHKDNMGFWWKHELNKKYIINSLFTQKIVYRVLLSGFFSPNLTCLSKVLSCFNSSKHSNVFTL